MINETADFKYLTFMMHVLIRWNYSQAYLINFKRSWYLVVLSQLMPALELSPLSRRQRFFTTAMTSDNARLNCFGTAGITILFLGLVLIVWAATSTFGGQDIDQNPLLLAGISLFGFGFLLVFIISILQQCTRSHSRPNITSTGTASRSASSPVGHDSPVFHVEVDEPPNYNQCFFVDTTASSNTTFPSPHVLEALKDISHLPTYQDLFGNQALNTSDKPWCMVSMQSLKCLYANMTRQQSTSALFGCKMSQYLARSRLTTFDDISQKVSEQAKRLRSAPCQWEVVSHCGPFFNNSYDASFITVHMHVMSNLAFNCAVRRS